ISVIFITCWTSKPLNSKKRRTRSLKTNVRQLPMWAKSYTVGPQQYMPAFLPAGSSGTNSCNERVSVLNIFQDITNGTELRRRREKMEVRNCSSRGDEADQCRQTAHSGRTLRQNRT